MSDFYTDKKRGFTGSVPANATNLSFKRWLNQELGGLFVTQKTAQDANGNMVFAKGHGLYEKIISEEKQVSVATQPKERLVLFNTYDYPDSRKLVRLIEIGSESYKEIYSFDLNTVFSGWTLIYNVSWSYRKNCFIVFLYDNDYYRIYEVRPYVEDGVQKGNATLVLSVDPYGSDWFSHTTGRHNYPTFHHSYGPTGQNEKMWLGFDEWYGGYYYILPLNSNYGFEKKGVFSSWATSHDEYDTNPDNFINPDSSKVYEIALADCDSYHHPTWNVPTLSWVTHNNIRILKPVTSEPQNWYGQANQMACEVGGKIAVIFDKDIQNGWDSFAVHLCNSFTSGVLFEESDTEKQRPYTPTSYMDNFATIMESEIFATGTTTYPPEWYLDSVSSNPYLMPGWSILSVEILGTETRWTEGIKHFVVIVAVVYGNGVDTVSENREYWFAGDYNSNQVSLLLSIMPVVYALTDTISGVKVIDGPGLDVKNPDGEYLSPDGLTNYHVDLGIGHAFSVALWSQWQYRDPSTYWVHREDYYDLRHVNGHYVMLAEENVTWDYRVFVADNRGEEKYEIALTDQDTVYEVKLERVIVQ